MMKGRKVTRNIFVQILNAIPNKGLYHQIIRINAYRTDKILLRAAENLLHLHSMIMIFLWINLFEVSYRMGETTFILYEYKDEKTKA